MKIFKCAKCNNMISYLNKDECDVKCCGETMVELVPNTSDGAGEKHVPVIEVDGNKVTVKVGEVDHPMLEAHYIQWIAIETEQGRQRKILETPCPPSGHRMGGRGKAAACPSGSAGESPTDGRERRGAGPDRHG